jgi:two-component system, cell cycle response regulator
VGDSVLRHVGMHILENIEKDMLPARYGGEEFAVICPEPPDMAVFTKNLKAIIQKDQVETEAGEKLGITISIGIADLTPDVTDIKDFIKRADDSLYCAKNTGRDRIVYYPEKPVS